MMIKNSKIHTEVIYHPKTPINWIRSCLIGCAIVVPIVVFFVTIGLSRGKVDHRTPATDQIFQISSLLCANSATITEICSMINKSTIVQSIEDDILINAVCSLMLALYHEANKAGTNCDVFNTTSRLINRKSQSAFHNTCNEIVEFFLTYTQTIIRLYVEKSNLFAVDARCKSTVKRASLHLWLQTSLAFGNRNLNEDQGDIILEIIKRTFEVICQTDFKMLHMATVQRKASEQCT